MLEVDGLTLRLGHGPLFAGISLRVNVGQRIALAGRNGQGKSTLMKIIMGEAGYDTGKVIVAKGHTLGYLPQDIVPPESSRGVVEELLAAIPGLGGLEDRIAELTERMAADPEDEELLAAYGKAQAEFEALDGYAIEAKGRTILAGLGFSQERMNGPLKILSGGWLMRVHLAKLLLIAPDMLLLDEPTNHLDLESREWLLEFLSTYEGAIILTSHDRYFLDHLVHKVFELESGRLDIYTGNYSDFERQRAERLEHLKLAHARQQRELKRQMVFIEKNRAKAATASNVQSRIKQLEKIELIELPPEAPEIKLRFPEPPSSGQLAFRLEDVGHSYGETHVFSGAELELPAGEKLAVVGVNGAGKSTLLKILSSQMAPSEGTLTLGHNVVIQVFSQYTDELPDDAWSLLQTMQEAAPSDCAVNLRSVLGCFLFSNDDVHKAIGVLSGGERARLKLARMLLKPSNLLVLDEPTNHLDLHSKGVLLEALENFSGTCVFVSHDRDFLASLATSVLEIRDGRATYYPCDYEQYRWRLARDLEERREAAAREKAQAKAKAEPKPAPAKPGKRSKARRRALSRLKKKVAAVQTRVEEEEARLAELEEQMSAPGFYDDRAASQPVVEEHKQLQVLIGASYEEFEEALAALEAAETQD